MRNIGSFTRFIQAMSFSQAAVLNLANVSREVQVSRKTVEGYLEVIEDLLLGFRLELFAKRAKRELATHPKLYFFDTGVFRASRPVGPLDSASEVNGKHDLVARSILLFTERAAHLPLKTKMLNASMAMNCGL